MDKTLLQIGELHSSPQVARRILALTAGSSFDLGQIAACLETDPALAAQVLRLVNSARYGVCRNISNLRHAVSMLGQRTLRLTSLTFCLVDNLSKGVGELFYQQYWKKSLATASFGSRLAQFDKSVDRDAAYCAGLLADVGLLAFAQTHRVVYTAVYKQNPRASQLIAAERERFGFHHAALGARLLERWQFPMDNVVATRNHHLPVDPNSDATALDLTLRTAAALSEVLWNPGDAGFETVRSVLSEQYRIDTDGIISLMMGVKQDVDDQCTFFGVRLKESIDCDALRNLARRRCVDASLEAAMDLDSMTAVLEDHSI